MSDVLTSEVTEPEGQRHWILFDGACSFCSLLAEYAARRALGRLKFMSWQDFQRSEEAAGLPALKSTGTDQEQLRAWDGLRLYQGGEAWLFLLKHHQDLRGLNWLAAKLGLLTGTALALEQTGHVARRFFCPSCKKRR